MKYIKWQRTLKIKNTIKYKSGPTSHNVPVVGPLLRVQHIQSCYAKLGHFQLFSIYYQIGLRRVLGIEKHKGKSIKREPKIYEHEFTARTITFFSGG
jgi:hypothetical protein